MGWGKLSAPQELHRSAGLHGNWLPYWLSQVLLVSLFNVYSCLYLFMGEASDYYGVSVCRLSVCQRITCRSPVLPVDPRI